MALHPDFIEIMRLYGQMFAETAQLEEEIRDWLATRPEFTPEHKYSYYLTLGFIRDWAKTPTNTPEALILMSHEIVELVQADPQRKDCFNHIINSYLHTNPELRPAWLAVWERVEEDVDKPDSDITRIPRIVPPDDKPIQ